MEKRTSNYESVGALAARIKQIVNNIPGGVVEGEIRKLNVVNGNCFLELSDADSTLRAIIFRSDLGRIAQLPLEGDLVHARYARVDFYAPYGQLSLIVNAIEPTGEGELLRRRQALLKQLQAEGLCDAANKKPFRPFPRRVGVIAGRDSAAKEDVIRSLRARFGPLDITFHEAIVQGKSAPKSVAAALRRLESMEDVDAIIIARGGGSVTDLAAFDDEQLCRVVFSCRKPVATSIGHFNDRPVCDFVSDAYAGVPAKSAEIVVAESMADVATELDRATISLSSVRREVTDRTERVSILANQVSARERFGGLVEGHSNAIRSLEQAVAIRWADRVNSVAAQIAELKAGRAQLPRPVLLEEQGSLLRKRGREYFTAHREAVANLARRAEFATAAFPGTKLIDVPTAQLAAAGRSITGRRRDLATAIDRRSSEAKISANRLLDKASEDLGTTAHLLSERAIAKAREESTAFAHTTALLAANDFQSRGFAFVEVPGGSVARSVSDVHMGDRVKVHFVDGLAESDVVNVKRSEELDG